MKTIIIPIFQSFISRSILITNAFKNLASDNNIRIILLVPDIKESFYKENFGRSNVIIEPVDFERVRALSSYFLQKIAISLLPTYFVKYRNREIRFLRGNYILYFFHSVIIYFLGPLPVAHRIFRFFDRILMDTEIFDGFMDKYKPDLVFATDISSPADATLLMSANKHNIRSIGMVRSWDCPTNKNLLRVLPGKIIALNENVAGELVKFHDVERSVIRTVGFPQFDPYFKLKPSSREDFYKKIGADINKKIVLFAPAGSDLADIDWQYCEILDDAQKRGDIPADICFLVRKHPQDKTDLSRIEGNTNFIIEQPGKSFGHQRSTEIDIEATQHLIDSIYHSELLISINTTLGLDALIFDKPHIMLAFDGYEKRQFLKSVRRFQQEDNMKDFIDTGAVKVVESADEMVLWINKYLREPKLNSTEREKARKEILFNLDGKSGDRIAEIILREI